MMTAEVHQKIAEATARGNELSSQGRYKEALEIFGELIQLFPQEDRESSQYAIVLGNIAAASAELGDLRSAGMLFRSALAIHRKLGEKEFEGTAHFNLGNISNYSNQWKGAIDHFRAAVEIFEEIGDRRRAALAGVNLGHFFLRLEPQKLAAPEFEKIDVTPEELEEWPDVGYSYSMLESYLQQSIADASKEDLRASLKSAAKALEFAQRLGHGSYIQEAKAAIARLTSRLGDDSALLGVLEESYHMAKTRGLRDFPEAAFSLAKHLRGAERYERAAELLEEALEVVDQRRHELHEAQKSLLMQRDFIYASEWLSLLVASGRREEAFMAAERLQGRTLFERMFRHQIKRHGGRTLTARGGKVSSGGPTWSDTLDVVRRDGLHVLRFAILPEKSLVGWWLTPGGDLHSWDATPALAALGALTSSLPTRIFFDGVPTIDLSKDEGQEIDFPKAPPAPRRSSVDRSTLKEFAAAILPIEVRKILDEESGRILLIPHQELSQVPWCALPIGDGGRPLGDRWQIAVVQSLAVFDQLDPRRDANYHGKAAADVRQAVVAGDCGEQKMLYPLFPNQDSRFAALAFEALPGARREAEDIARTLGVDPLLGEQFTRHHVFAKLHRATVVHLATHGLWNPLAGELSFLVIAGTSKEDSSALSAREIGYRILQAELVTLSACQTGLGEPNPDSDLGLTGSLLIAGARTVLISLWPISDSATHRFMLTFYRNLVGGQSPAAALQSTQANFRRTPGLEDPLFWAGFQLVGRPFAPVGEEAAGGSFAGPTFCGGDLVLLDYPEGEALDLEAHANVHQRGYGESLWLRDGAVVTTVHVEMPDEHVEDLWLSKDPS